MTFELRFTQNAADVLTDLAAQPQHEAKLAKVRRCLGRLQRDPRHPGLNSHKYHSLVGPEGEEVWESYVENRTPGAWRVWWVYGPDRGQITVVAIGPHPD